MLRESIENLDDGCVRVCLFEGEEPVVCTTVSSHHLIEDRGPMRRAVSARKPRQNKTFVRLSHAEINLIDFFTYFKANHKRNSAAAQSAMLIRCRTTVLGYKWRETPEPQLRQSPIMDIQL